MKPKSQIDSKHFAPLGNVRSLKKTERGLLLDVGEERFRVEVIRADILRLAVSQAGEFDESPTFASAFEMPEAVAFSVNETAESVSIETSRMRLVIGKRPFALDAYRSDGTVIFEDQRDEDAQPIGYLSLNDSFIIARKSEAHDSIYGLGQRTGRLDRRGRNFILWNTDILAPDVLRRNGLHEADVSLTGRSTDFDPYYTSIPFFYHCRSNPRSASMAGFFVDNGYKGNFEFEGRDTYRYRFSGGQYTEYVFAGPTMKEILEGYAFITGKMAAPPIWALGHHQCRWRDYTAEELQDLGREYRERGIPCDVLWLDIGYMNGYRVFTWNTEKFPDLPGTLAGLQTDKFRLITIVDPGVKYDPGYAVFEEGRAKNLFCKTDSGKLYLGQVWPGRTAFPDFVKPEARAWWGELNARHVASGIAGIWNDMNEPATGDVEPFAMRFDRDGENHAHERYHNQYALLMAMGTHQGLKAAEPNLRTFILSRAGFAGIQRYAAQWLGDNFSDWDHVRMSLPMAMGMGLSGQPFIGADIPGFMSSPDAELAIRWMQYGALTPFCRCHNTWGEPDQYPWSFGPGVEKRSREALELRYRLLPYIYSSFMRASETAEPIQRPLVYDFQNDRQARETDDAYLFGEALLVAPVLKAGQTARHVYLPQGTWIDWHTDERHVGGQCLTAAAPLDRIPLFARGGRVIPSFETAPSSTMNHHAELIVLHVFIPDEDGDFTSYLHEDDGLTTAHETGACLRTTFKLVRQGPKLTLSAAVSGKGYPEFKRSRLRVVLHGFQGSSAVLDGKSVSVHLRSFEFENRGQPFEIGLAL